MFKIKSKDKGFSLIGIIVSIFIISVGLMGILGLANTSLKGAALSKARLIASGLAQEGVEVVKGIRKLNEDDESNWGNWHSNVVSGDYRIQYDSSSLMPFSETPLNLDTTSGLYQYDSGTNSIFYRKVSLTKNPDGLSDDQVKVVVEIKWLLKGGQHVLIVEDRLWNWK